MFKYDEGSNVGYFISNGVNRTLMDLTIKGQLTSPGPMSERYRRDTKVTMLLPLGVI